LIIDPATARPLEFKETAHRQLGYSREEFSGLSISDLEAAETPEETRSRIAHVIHDGRADFETRQRTRQGEIRNVHVTAQNTDILGKPVYHCIWRDITAHKRAEEALRESTALYRLLAEHMTDIVWMMNLDLNVTWLSPSAMKARGFSVDEIAALPLDRQLTPESLGKAVNWLGKLMRLEKDGLISEPDGILSRELEFYCKDGRTIVLDCTFQFIRDEQGKATGILAEGKDITERKRAEEKLLRTLESLRKAFGATVQVMVSAVEVRDPYTAGHQVRSADLARAIAMEMELPQDKIDAIRMSGSIHDIGKLSIPAEILSKPTKLSEIEFSLIKEHARKGYEMLKDVESPWPLAEIVYQHHERMDGSGYPRKLKGEEILIEARILAVADVVEAMASHRPYRPGLGIDAALNEIEKNSGIFYDNAVAEACLRLFREKGFKLERT
jgi:PAS domain S-box-containing protein